MLVKVKEIMEVFETLNCPFIHLMARFCKASNFADIYYQKRKKICCYIICYVEIFVVTKILCCYVLSNILLRCRILFATETLVSLHLCRYKFMWLIYIISSYVYISYYLKYDYLYVRHYQIMWYWHYVLFLFFYFYLLFLFDWNTE